MTTTIELLSRMAGPPVEVDRDLRFTRDVTEKAYAYWNAMRGERPWPTRKDMTPQGMKAFMGNVSIVEVRKMADGHKSFFVRFAGAKVESVYGSITGKTLSEFLPAALEARWRLVFDMPIEEKAPIRIATRVMFGGKNYLAAEVFLAPLGEGPDPSMVFAALDVWPAVGAEPPKA